MGVMTSPAFASGKPTAETKAATGVEISVATLNGVVNPEGLATEYRFEYGTASVEEHKTAWVAAGSGTTNVPVSTKLTALAVDTKYEFRLKATNGEGSATGATLNFTTKGSTAPPKFNPADGQSMTSKGGEFKIHYYSGTITCTKETGNGNVTGQYTVGKVNLTFTGCTTIGNEGQGPCNISSVGAANQGEIVIRPLKGQLGIVPTAQQENATGLLLEGENNEEWATLGNAETSKGVLCGGETEFSGKLAVGVGVLGTSQVTNKLTAALSEPGEKGKNITEIKLASGETVKPHLWTFGETTTVLGVDEVTFGVATEVS
jgi:hypothetical protein